MHELQRCLLLSTTLEVSRASRLENAMIVNCPRCGSQMPQNLFGGTGNISFNNSKMSCPKCGNIAPIRDGKYEVVGSVLRSFQGVSRENIERLKEIALSVKVGSTDNEQADIQVEQLGSVIATVWKAANTNSGALSLFLAIITLYLTITQLNDSNDTNRMLQLNQSTQTQIQEQILGVLQKQTSQARPQQVRSPSRPPLQVTEPTQKLASAPCFNRYERRKAASKKRRQSKP